MSFNKFGVTPEVSDVEFINRMGTMFHKTRRTSDINVNPQDFYRILNLLGYYTTPAAQIASRLEDLEQRIQSLELESRPYND